MLQEVERNYSKGPRVIGHNIGNGLEDLILTGMIISKEFMEEISHVVSPEFFQSPHIQQVMGWVIEYWQENKDVPKETIQEIYQAECRNAKVEDQDLIHRLLSNMFEKYEGREFNHTYMKTKTLEYIRERSVHVTIEEASWLLKRKGADAAESRIAQHEIVKEKTSKVRESSFFRNFKRKFDAWFYQDRTPLITFPGALGRYMQPLLRGKLIAYLAPPKSGKSWHLINTAYMGLTQKKNVLFFSLEMSEEEVNERFTSMMLGRERTLNSKPVEYWVPVYDCILNQNGECNKSCCPNRGVSILKNGQIPKYEDTPEHIPCTKCRGLKDSNYIPTTWVLKEIRKPLQHGETFKQISGLEKHFNLDKLKIITYGIGTASISDIEDNLDELELREGWLPDVICLDYADLLRHDTTYREKRHQIGSIWENLSRVAKTRKILIFTASQGNRGSMAKSKLSASDISEDFSKVMTADALIAINSDNGESDLTKKDSYWFRHDLQWVVHRYKKHLHPWETCQVLHQFDLGQPVIDSEII